LLRAGLLAPEMVKSTRASIIVSTQHRSEAVGFSEPTATLLAALAKRKNSCIPACHGSLGFRLQFERGIRVSVYSDLLNVLLKKSFSSRPLVLGYVNEFVCQQPKISRAVQANNDAMPRRQTVVSAERGKGRSFMRSSFEVRRTR
jgi:hypothetical protein